MENQFSTTFIPKKPLVQEATTNAPVSRPVGFLSSISVVIFFITLLISGGMWFWERYETGKVAELSDSVIKAQKRFEPSFITKLQSLDKQLKNAQILVKNHTVMSPVFDLLEASTIKPVQFSKFDVSLDEAKGFMVKMSGVADGYKSIAQQSDSLGSSSFLKNTIFSNFFLTPQGKVSFDLSFGVRPDFLSFQTAPLASAPSNSALVDTAESAQ